MIAVPPLSGHSAAEADSEHLRLELNLKALDVQRLLLEAAGQHALIQLGMSRLGSVSGRLQSD